MQRVVIHGAGTGAKQQRVHKQARVPRRGPYRKDSDAADGIAAQPGVEALGIPGFTRVLDVVGHDPANVDVAALALIDDLVQKRVLSEGSVFYGFQTACRKNAG